MTHIRRSAKKTLMMFASILMLTFAAVWIIQSSSARPGEDQVLQNAWKLLRTTGGYDFSTSLEQITYPAPRLSNVGASSRRDVYYLSGQTDLTENFMQFSMWQNQGSVLNQKDGLEIRVEDGKVSGRAIGAAWQPLENFSTGSFAPGNDSAAFLVATKNVALQERVNLSIPQPDQSTHTLSATRYSFVLDPDHFASYMRDQMVQELQRAGRHTQRITRRGASPGAPARTDWTNWGTAESWTLAITSALT